MISKLILILLPLFGLLLCEQIELQCPKGWIVQGQHVYAKNVFNIKRETVFALCLICQLNSSTNHTFGVVEVCQSNVDFQVSVLNSSKAHK